MDKIKILVACHKPAKVYQDEVYTPIQVGKALHPELDLGFITDATGENISALNSQYCELTAQYWGWKNLDCEFIGLNHYRRYFDLPHNSKNIEGIFTNFDVILASPLYLNSSIFEFWCKALVPEDVYVAMKLLKKVYPEDYQKGVQFLGDRVFYPCNMFVCRKILFNDFAKWQFTYLEELRKRLRISSYSREARILGFIGEGLLPLYFLNRNYRIKTLPIVPFPGSTEKLLHNSIREKFVLSLKSKIKEPEIVFDDTLLAGLRYDGILDKNNNII